MGQVLFSGAIAKGTSLRERVVSCRNLWTEHLLATAHFTGKGCSISQKGGALFLRFNGQSGDGNIQKISREERIANPLALAEAMQRESIAILKIKDPCSEDIPHNDKSPTAPQEDVEAVLIDLLDGKPTTGGKYIEVIFKAPLDGFKDLLSLYPQNVSINKIKNLFDQLKDENMESAGSAAAIRAHEIFEQQPLAAMQLLDVFYKTLKVRTTVIGTMLNAKIYFLPLLNKIYDFDISREFATETAARLLPAKLKNIKGGCTSLPAISFVEITRKFTFPEDVVLIFEKCIFDKLQDFSRTDVRDIVTALLQRIEDKKETPIIKSIEKLIFGHPGLFEGLFLYQSIAQLYKITDPEGLAWILKDIKDSYSTVPEELVAIFT